MARPCRLRDSGMGGIAARCARMMPSSRVSAAAGGGRPASTVREPAAMQICSSAAPLVAAGHAAPSPLATQRQNASHRTPNSCCSQQRRAV